jgi:hypothetical protein
MLWNRTIEDQAPGECQPGISIIRWSVANDLGLGEPALDPERPSEVVAERGCTWTDSVHPEDSWGCVFATQLAFQRGD